MATVTHLPPRCNALRIKDKLLAHQTPKRACSGCGQDFQLTRSWQKHCSTKMPCPRASSAGHRPGILRGMTYTRAMYKRRRTSVLLLP